MEILSNEAHHDVIGWLPHGKGFIIYKKKKFAAEILPLYFKQSKFTSFTRKLNRWGFTRVTRGPETGAYYHKFFRKGDLRLCMQMSCQSSKVMPQQQTSGAQPGLGNFNAGFGATANGLFAGGNPADIAQQNQSLIRHQLQQLQMQQLHLQQLQMQQQQQLQAAEFMRQALSKQNGGQQGAGEEELNNSSSSGKYDPNSLFLQTLQRTKDSGSGLMGSGPIALLPANTPGLGEPTRPTAGNGRAWAA